MGPVDLKQRKEFGQMDVEQKVIDEKAKLIKGTFIVNGRSGERKLTSDSESGILNISKEGL